MTTLQQVLSSECVHCWGWTLLHSLWQMAIVGTLVTLLLGFLHRRSANLRYVIACVGLAAMFLSPLATYCLMPKAACPAMVLASTPTTVSPLLTEPLADMATVPRNDPSRTIRNDQPGADSETSRSPRLLDLATRLFSPCVPWTVLIWLIGVMGLSTWRLGGFVAAGRLRYVGVMPIPESFARSFHDLKTRLRVTQPVRLVQSLLVEVPVAIGWLRPVILVPVSVVTGLAPQEIEAVLAHELAHVRRCDYLVNLLQTVAETLLFYHPAVWWVSRQIRIERELCCDDAAVAACGSKVDYARALTTIEKNRTAPEWAMAATGGKKAGATLSRVRRILGVSTQSRSRASAWLGGMIVLVLVGGPAVIIPFTLAAPAAKSETENKAGQSDGKSAQAAKQPDSGEPAKASAADGANGQAAGASARRSDSDESEWFHLVRGASACISTSWPDGAVESPIIYDDYNKNYFMTGLDRAVMLPQPGDRYGPTSLDVPAYKMLRQPSTQRELKLTAEQKKKLQEISSRYWPEREKLAGQDLAKRGSNSGKENEELAAKARKAWELANKPSETVAKRTVFSVFGGTGSQAPTFSKETVGRLESQWRDTRKQIEDVLTPDQLTVLKDLTFRTLAFGSGIMSHPLVVGRLGLTTKQQEELKQLALRLQQEKTRRLAQITRDRISKILAVLTPQQLAELRERCALQLPGVPERPYFDFPYPALPFRDADGAADELGLSAAQRTQVRDMMNKYVKATGEIDKERAKLSLDDEAGLKANGEKTRQLVTELNRQVEAALTPQQIAMLKEMAFQNIVIPALLVPAAPEKVAGNNQEKAFFDEQQKATLRQIEIEFFDKPEQVYCELTAKALKVFTPAQQAILRAEVDRRGW